MWQVIQQQDLNTFPVMLLPPSIPRPFSRHHAAAQRLLCRLQPAQQRGQLRVAEPAAAGLLGGQPGAKDAAQEERQPRLELLELWLWARTGGGGGCWWCVCERGGGGNKHLAVVHSTGCRPPASPPGHRTCAAILPNSAAAAWREATVERRCSKKMRQKSTSRAPMLEPKSATCRGQKVGAVRGSGGEQAAPERRPV